MDVPSERRRRTAPSELCLADFGDHARSGLNYIRLSFGTHLGYLRDIAGGLIVTMPTEADWSNPYLRPYIEEELRGSSRYSTEYRLRVMSLVQDLAASRLTGTMFGFTIKAAGWPATNAVVVRGIYDLEGRVRLAKRIAGLQD